MTVPVPELPMESIETVRKWARRVGGRAEQLVEQAVKLVHAGLGDPGKVEQARTAWNTTAVSAVATGRNGITNALPELAARWTGSGFMSFNGYATNVVGASDKVGTALTGVGGALTEAYNTVTATYQAVLALVAACADAILGYLAEGLNGIQADALAAVGVIAGAIVNAINKFVQAYFSALQTALGLLKDYKNAANTAASSIAALGKDLVPALPAGAGDTGSYMPVKQGA